jgi:hypothetical protein
MSMSTRTIGPQRRNNAYRNRIKNVPSRCSNTAPSPSNSLRLAGTIPKHRIAAMKSMLLSAALVISFARVSAGSLDPTISCLFPREWNIDLKISAMTSFMDRKAARPTHSRKAAENHLFR